jgi:hypothetical protein
MPRVRPRLFRRGSSSWLRSRFRAALRRKRHLRAELTHDLVQWLQLGDQRRALAVAAEQHGDDWEAQARAQNLPIDRRGLALHERCSAYIAKYSLKRGHSPWMRSRLDVPPTNGWDEYAIASGMPSTSAALRAIISDSLSFPLTAAYAARLAGVAADHQGRLSLLVLGAEVGSELGGLGKWAELLGSAHGLGVRELSVLFVGPRVPTRLDGSSRRLRMEHGELRLAFVRGAWHSVAHRLPPGFSGPPQMAMAFNSGLAEHADSWLPTLRQLHGHARVPIAFTSYHKPEAELDARTLVVRLGVRVSRMRCMPNPFASLLPHLDEIIPGSCYHGNSFLSVCLP